MNKRLFGYKHKALRKNLRNTLAVLLAVLLTTGAVPLSGIYAVEVDEHEMLSEETHEIIITEEQLSAFEAIQEFNESFVGLVGFEGELALRDDDAQVPIIVFFESTPASTQVIEAAMEGYFLSLDSAMQVVEDEHASFRRELSGLFGSTRGRTAAGYHITIEYRHTFNGVSMTLPGNMVEAVAGLDSVRAVFPDFPLDPPDVIEDDVEGFVPFDSEEGQAATNTGTLGQEVWGGLQGRLRMNANELHDRGYDGEGIIIAVIDSGIDWMHPAFANSFPPASVIYEARQARFGPNGTAGHRPALVVPLWDGANNPGGYNELFNVNRYTHGDLDTIGRPRTGEAPDYRFVGRDHMRLWPGGQGNDPRANPLQRGGSPGHAGSPATWTYQVPMPFGMPGNNPMEASPLNFATDAGIDMRQTYGLWPAGPGNLSNVWGTHGTHVSGSILGRPFGDDPGTAIMGVAPGAWGVHYRGLYGGQRVYASVWISGQEWAFLDGATVANMSLGYQMAAAMSIMNNSVNNLMLADPTMVFTISAGNSGPNFYTGGNPGGSIMAITVSALAEPMRGLTVESADFTGLGAATFVTARDNARVEELGNGNFVINHPNAGLLHNNGEFKIFAMPRVNSAVQADAPVGTGTVAEFAALYNEHGVDLEGHFVLVRRGETAANLNTRAHNIGLGGVIAVNDPNVAPLVINAAGTLASLTSVPILQLDRTAGAQWATNLTEGDGYGSFRFTNNNVISDFTHGSPITNTGGLPSTQGFSSRGPLAGSFTISPDVGSQGVNVFSAHPRFSTAGTGLNFAQINTNHAWRDIPWERAHQNSSGTSMSAPHVAGAVALMQQYSQQNNLGAYNGMWGNYEIRTRMMNTAIQLDYPGNIYGAFDGARNVDVWAATQTNTVVFAEYNRIPTVLFVPYNSPMQNHESTLKGSFSFGGFNVHPGLSGSTPNTPAANGIRNIGERAGSYTIRAYIENNGSAEITYAISHNFIPAGQRPARPAGSMAAPIGGATLAHPSSLTVPAGQRVGFDVTINLPEGSEVGFHEGFVRVTGGSHEIVLPFAAVAYSQEPTFEFLGLYRPVITTNKPGEGAQNVTSNELIMHFQQTWGFAAVFYLIDRGAVREAEILNPNLGFGPDTWLRSTINPDGTHEPEFAEFILGTTMQTAEDYANRWSRYFPRNRGGGVNPADTMRGVIFDGYYTPGIWESPAGIGERTRLMQEGEFYIGISIFRQTPTATLPGQAAGHSHWVFWEQSLLVPFYVDNTPPVFNSITVNDIEVDMLSRTTPAVHVEPMITFNEEIEEYSHNDLVITGNVFDEWIAEAIEGTTFDVWNEHLFGGQVSNPFARVNKANNLALWVLAGDNEDGNRPIRANVEPNGDFNVTLHGALTGEEVELNFWLIDGYAPVPVVNQVPIGVGNPHAPQAPADPNNWWNVPAVARTLSGAESHFELYDSDGFVNASGLEALLRSDVVFGRHSINPAVNNIPAEHFNHFVWSGLNVAQFSVTATWEDVPVAEFGLYAFNNGNDNNASLAEAGLIRIWPQLNGVTAPISMSAVVTAVDQDGFDAMEFVRKNRGWNDATGWQDFFINFDVNKHAPWQTITLTVTVYGQVSTLTLINNRFLGLHAYNNGTDAEVPSMAGNIRIWPKLGGSIAPIPMDAIISAIDQNGNNAMEFVSINRLWSDAGWQDYNANFDVTKDAPWETIVFSVTVYGQTVVLELINDWFNSSTPVQTLGLQAFNNGNDNNASLAQAGLIRIWTQLDGANALVPFAVLTVEAKLLDGTCAMEFVRINRIWNNPEYVNMIDVNKNTQWQYIDLSVDLGGQSIDLRLINNRFAPDSAESM